MTDILIVAGEPSGDALGAELVTAVRQMAPDVRFFGATGPLLEAAGVDRVVPTADLAVMGIIEVAGRLPAIRRAMSHLASAALERHAAGAILIDSPDFNLRLARRLARRSLPVVQYVSPTVWAWRKRRTATIARYVRRLLLTLPFETAVYEGTGVDTVYVGNPAVDRTPVSLPSRDEVATRIGLEGASPWVAIAPGSRAVELRRMGPILARAAGRIAEAAPEVEFVVPVAPGVRPDDVAAAVEGGPRVRIVAEGRLETLAHCAAAVITSGTVSLELALLGVPHAVAYRTTWPTFWIARALVSVRHIALPNLIAGHVVVPEFVQGAATPDNIATPVVTWLTEETARDEISRKFDHVKKALGGPGVARRAARSALEVLAPGSLEPPQSEGSGGLTSP
jgi:lipid-A-disaccharide synthase